MKRSASMLVLLLLFSVVFVSSSQIEVVKAQDSSVFIRADGSVEGTDKIQREGNVYSFIDNIRGSIVVEKDNVVVDGAGYALQGEGIGEGEGISLDGRINVTIKNVHVIDFVPCIHLNNSSNNIISNNTLTSNVEFSPPWVIQLRNLSNNNKIVGNIIEQETEDWLHDSVVDIRKSLYNEIVGNNITSNMRCIGIDNYANHTIISGNTISSTRKSGDVSFWGQNTTFSHNILVGCSLHIYRSSQNTVVNNLVDGKPLIYLDGVTDQVIDDGEAGQIILANCRNVKVENYDFSNIVTGGIQLLWTNSSEVSNYTGSIYLENSFYNRIVGSNCVEIEFYTSSNNTITKNTVTNSEGYDYSSGITFRSSDYNSVIENNITQNHYSGIELWKSSYNYIAFNQLTYNAEGINFQQSSNNTVYGNNVAYNHNAGIFVQACSDNMVFENNFVDNDRQVMGWDSTNAWDNGTIGNYWSDYNGTDVDNDGIGDLPYSFVINSHFTVDNIINHDNFPLMKPVDIEVIPEFPSWTPLLIMLVAVMAVAVIYRRILSNPNRGRRDQ